MMGVGRGEVFYLRDPATRWESDSRKGVYYLMMMLDWLMRSK
jgi:hypothetical protein